MTVTITTPPTHGMATVNGETITYTPTGGYTGMDTLNYQATNSAGSSTVQPLNITVTAVIPTLGEWGMIGFGVLVAGGGALAMRRRRVA